jgi:hypothetical protein
MELRPAVLAGRWYPAGAAECSSTLEAMPAQTVDPAGSRGAIVPHAGWSYSGAIAMQTLRPLGAARSSADLVVIFGGHLAKNDLPRLFVEGGFETPLGPLVVPEGLAQDLAMALGDIDLESPQEFYDENGVEVLLPMIKHLWPDAPVLAVGAPPNPKSINLGKEVVDLARRRGFRDLVLLGSTDLTHYGPSYDFRPKGSGFTGLRWVKEVNDPAILQAMVALDPAEVLWVAERNHNACCAGAAAAAIAGCRALGAGSGSLVRYATSWDERPSGPEPTSFVGYGGVLIRE